RKRVTLGVVDTGGRPASAGPASARTSGHADDFASPCRESCIAGFAGADAVVCGSPGTSQTVAVADPLRSAGAGEFGLAAGSRARPGVPPAKLGISHLRALVARWAFSGVHVCRARWGCVVHPRHANRDAEADRKRARSAARRLVAGCALAAAIRLFDRPAAISGQ